MTLYNPPMGSSHVRINVDYFPPPPRDGANEPLIEDFFEKCRAEGVVPCVVATHTAEEFWIGNGFGRFWLLT